MAGFSGLRSLMFLALALGTAAPISGIAFAQTKNSTTPTTVTKKAAASPQTSSTPSTKAAANPSKIENSASSSAEAKTAAAVAAATAPRIALSQRKVAELVLTQSDRTAESNLRADLPRFDYATVLSTLDWNLTAESGYEISKFENFAQSHNAKDETYRTSLLLKKPWITGTTTTLEWNRNSLQSEYFTGSPQMANLPSQQTQDIFGVTVEQNLWRNSFGSADRARVRAANENLNAAVVTRANDLQNNVLEGLRKFWNAYVAEETFKEALSSRERYEKLAENVRKKSSFGYSSPGELPQIRAELEARGQNAKNQSTNYIRSLEDLLLYLGYPANATVDFQVENSIPTPPILPEIKVTDLRSFKAQDLRYKAAQEVANAAGSNREPNLSLVGKAYSSGIEEKANDSIAESFSGTHPKYYIGLKLEVPFGSDVRNEDLVNKQILAKIEEIKKDRLQRDLDSRLGDQERKVLSAHAVALSLGEQRTHREKAMQEINRAYTQGRIDIRNVIESMNLYFQAKIDYSRAVGDYQIALAELAALRDELIPSPKEGQ